MSTALLPPPAQHAIDAIAAFLLMMQLSIFVMGSSSQEDFCNSAMAILQVLHFAHVALQSEESRACGGAYEPAHNPYLQQEVKRLDGIPHRQQDL